MALIIVVSKAPLHPMKMGRKAKGALEASLTRGPSPRTALGTSYIRAPCAMLQRPKRRGNRQGRAAWNLYLSGSVVPTENVPSQAEEHLLTPASLRVLGLRRSIQEELRIKSREQFYGFSTMTNLKLKAKKRQRSPTAQCGNDHSRRIIPRARLAHGLDWIESPPKESPVVGGRRKANNPTPENFAPQASTTTRFSPW